MSETPLAPDARDPEAARDAAAKQYGLHPLAAVAAAGASETEGGGVVFSEESLEEVRTGLQSIDDVPELEDALRSLVKVAAYVGEDRGSQEEAIRLIRIAGEGALLLQRHRTERNVTAQQDAADKVGQALRKFMGSAETKRAPMEGGKKPAGEGVKLDALFKPRNISGK